MLAFALAGCTLIVIKGNENAIKDTGHTRGGQLTIQPPAPASQPDIEKHH